MSFLDRHQKFQADIDLSGSASEPFDPYPGLRTVRESPRRGADEASGVPEPPSQSIPTDPSHRCQHCDRVQISVSEDTKAHYSRTRRRWSYTLPHTMNEVSSAASDGCPFFAWVFCQIKRSSTPKKQIDDTQLQLDFETGETPNHLVAENTRAVEVLVSTKHYSWPASRFNVVSHFADPSSHQAIARSIVGNVSATTSLDQVSRRLDHCRRHHPGCNSEPTQTEERSGQRAVPLRFLNVDAAISQSEVTLVRADATSAEPYVTLSYVWGHDQVVKTTLGTMSQHGSGIPIITLPKTIQDAIVVTRHIGMTLLWVDSLCITQDAPEELDMEIANMAAYYKNSQLTIVAGASPSCSHGFLVPSSNPQGPEGFELPFSSGNTTESGRIRFSPLGGPSEEVIDTRAWTLQEGLLSTRIASFGKDLVSWSCLSDEYGDMQMADLRKALRDAKAAAKITIRDWKTIQDRQDLQSFWAYLGSHFQNAWHEIVCRYCDRHLSEDADGLVAISGIAHEFSSSLWPDAELPGPSEKGNRPKYIAGLWDSALLPLQLLWQPRSSIPDPPSKAYVAPSWSWASARAPLRRDQDTYKIWLTKAQVTDFKVLRHDISLRNEQAPFGALTSGSLLVQGLTWTVNSKVGIRYVGHAGISITLDTDVDESAMVRDEPAMVRWRRTTRFASSLPVFLPSRYTKQVVLLEIVSSQLKLSAKEDDDSMDYPRGLVLAATEDGKHRRIGLCYYRGDVAGRPRENDKDVWKMQELTLV
ncbi:heterokaryon incompatibility protein-domain-containing protein [Podospora conica]|nr:heterokaryon incompatibility protein-domain-containing protein [Schizothecium conicum]